MLTRRQFLASGVATGGALLVPNGWTRAMAAAEDEPEPIPARAVRPFVDPLTIPPIITTAQLAASGLPMRSRTHRFHRDLGETPTFAYATDPAITYLGPIVIAQRGQPVTYVASNQLGPHPLGIDTSLHGPDDGGDDAASPRASVHMHGNYVAPGSDGAPDDTFLPGQTHTYHWLNDQQSATLWYHDHALGITRLNVYAGLASGYLIRDQIEASLGLPSGEFEVPLVIQDKAFLPRTASGQQPLFYPNPWEPEFFGNMALVNGTVWPYHDVKAGMYRFRVYNGSSSRFWHLTLRPVAPMWQIGTDTGLLRTPVAIDSIVLAPGERTDLLVDFSRFLPGDQVKLRNARLPMRDREPGRAPHQRHHAVPRRRGRRAGGDRSLDDPGADRSDDVARRASPDRAADRDPGRGRGSRDGAAEREAVGDRRHRAPDGEHPRAVGDRQPDRRHAPDPPAPGAVPRGGAATDRRRRLHGGRVRHDVDDGRRRRNRVATVPVGHRLRHRTAHRSGHRRSAVGRTPSRPIQGW